MGSCERQLTYVAAMLAGTSRTISRALVSEHEPDLWDPEHGLDRQAIRVDLNQIASGVALKSHVCRPFSAQCRKYCKFFQSNLSLENRNDITYGRHDISGPVVAKLSLARRKSNGLQRSGHDGRSLP